MFTIDFFDSLTVRVEGNGELATSLREYFGRLIVNRELETFDLKLNEWDAPPDPKESLGDPETYYGRSDDRFIIRDRRNFVSMDRMWTDIRASPETSHFFVAYLIEFTLRKRLAKRGYALIHASGVDLNGHTVVFPAWRHTGKTNTMLSLLAGGGGYLSDDRVWIHESGDILGYPLPVNMLPYNFDSFPELLDVSSAAKLRDRISDRLYSVANKERSIFDKIAYFVAKFYIDVDLAEVVQLDELLRNSEFMDEATLDKMVFLRTAPKIEDGCVNIDELDSGDAHTSLTTTSYYEWNRRIEEYCRAFDSLFNNGKKTREIESLVAKESEIFDSTLDNTSLYRMQLPREEEWNEAGLTSQVQNAINELPSNS